VAVLIVAAGMCTGAQAQVMDQVPAEAFVVVKCAKLQDTSAKLAKFMHELGVDAFQPELADPLGALQGKMKAQNGVDKNGELAWVFCDPAVAENEPDKSVLVLVPISDYKAFLSNWPDAKADGNISEVNFGNADEPGFVANWGKYAAISPSKAVVGLKPAGIKAQGLAAKEIASKDIVAFVNMPKLREKAQPKLAEARTKLQGEVEQGLANDADAQKYAPVVKALVNELVDVADQLMKDASGVTYGIGLEDQGIRTTVVAEFNSGSDTGNAVAKLKNTNEPLLAGLPTGKYLVFGGGISDPQATLALINKFVDPLVAELKKVNAGAGGGADNDATAGAISKYVDAFKAYVGALQGQPFGMIAPGGQIGQEPLIQFVSIQKGDPNKLKSAQQQMMTTQQDMMKALSGGKQAMKVTQTPNAKTVEGVSFDQMVSQVDVAAAGPNAQQAQMMMNTMYGPNGITILSGVVGDRLLVASGVTDEVLAQAVRSAKANVNNLDKLAGVQSVSAQLPKNRSAAFFIPLDQIVNTAATYAQAFGMPVQIQLPQDLPPIGGTIATEGNAVRLDSYTPTELVRAVVAAGMQVAQQMQGGGRHPGGPGGL